MTESLEDFLGVTKKNNMIEVSGSFSCSECDEVVNEGRMSDDDHIMIYYCSYGHESRVQL